MILRSAIDKLTRHFRHYLPAASAQALAPLMDEDELQALAVYARSLPSSLLHFRRPASHPLIGETQSFYRGRGFEFEEHRAYQPGDEPRLLNWHLYARTGELFTKVFGEERRPQVFILLDRRATMRFATRRQLKVTLAAKIAACYAWQAQQQALAVGGLVLNQTPDWLDPAIGDVSLQYFVQALAAPCPPLPFDDGQSDLGECLLLLLHRLPHRSFVLLISDFHDLDPDASMPVLQQLATEHTLQAIQILDPVETRLPLDGDFLIEDKPSGQPLRIDGRDSQQQRLFTQACQDQQLKLFTCFNRCDIPLRSYTTRDGLKTCLGTPDADTGAD